MLANWHQGMINCHLEVDLPKQNHSLINLNKSQLSIEIMGNSEISAGSEGYAKKTDLETKP